MTRFARAKGSKSSNERLPEEATPWQQLKIIVANKIAKEQPKETTQNCESPKLIQPGWSQINIDDNLNHKIKQGKVKKNKNTVFKTEQVRVNKKVAEELTFSPTMKKNKKKQMKMLSENEDCNKIKNKNTSPKRKVCEEELEKVVEKKTKKMKQKHMKMQSENGDNENASSQKQPSEEEFKKEKKKARKMKQVHLKMSSENGDGDKGENKKTSPKRELTEEELKKIEKKKARKVKQIEKRKDFKTKKSEELKKKGVANKNVRLPKTFQNKQKVRRKPLEKENTIIINGEKVKVSYFDGFPVLKSDEKRLKALRKEMKMKGIPNDEIRLAMKLERRKAEKALSREKHKVCFNCRNQGHNLSDCPELNKDNPNQDLSGTGICFKCGSTEHTHFECKVIHGQEFRFAVCFVCNQQGHLARQCPDNPKGLYPKGGACRECGDITHLKKDCPKYQATKEEQQIYLDTIDGSNLESLGNEKIAKSAPVVRQKIVKF